MRSPQAAVLAGGSTPATPATPKESRGAARQAFERFDADRSGTLSKDECLAFIDDTGFYGITRGYLDGVWSVYDRNADGALDFKEFSTFYTVLAQRSQKRQTQAPTPEPEPEPSGQGSSGAEPAGQAHGDKFPNCVESPAGSGSFVLPMGKKLLYAWPGLGYYAMRYLRTIYMKKWYADVVGVPLWWIACAVALAVSLDALTDPLYGFVSDRARWTIGGQPVRRRAFIAIGSVVLAVLFLLLWSPCVLFDECSADEPTICDDQTSISGSAPMYFLIVYVIYFCTMGATLVPYEALGAELTPVSYSQNLLSAGRCASCA